MRPAPHPGHSKGARVIEKLVCRLRGHADEVRSNGKPLGSNSVFRNDYIYAHCSRCGVELRRWRDW
jgi:hypothetical protein